jgi:hypothetical protein
MGLLSWRVFVERMEEEQYCTSRTRVPVREMYVYVNLVMSDDDVCAMTF